MSDRCVYVYCYGVINLNFITLPIQIDITYMTIHDYRVWFDNRVDFLRASVHMRTGHFKGYSIMTYDIQRILSKWPVHTWIIASTCSCIWYMEWDCMWMVAFHMISRVESVVDWNYLYTVIGTSIFCKRIWAIEFKYLIISILCRGNDFRLCSKYKRDRHFFSCIMNYIIIYTVVY